MGVGGVKGGQRMKVPQALDLVTFLTGLLNSLLRVITMEIAKDTINLYSFFIVKNMDPQRLSRAESRA